MIARDAVRAIIEAEVAKDRFSMPKLFRAVSAASTESAAWNAYQTLSNLLGAQVASHILQGVLRATFLIELVKTPKIETTKFEVRWASRLGFDDPRYATYDTCFAIYEGLMRELDEALLDPRNIELLRLFERHSLLPYELPLDYQERRIEQPIHEPGNLFWMWDSLPWRVVELRALLRNSAMNHEAALFAVTYKKKIMVKTYLTDRVLTGEHKTNREKRWEAHPGSVHFALRRACFEIEHALIEQVCGFLGFPPELLESLTLAELIVPVDAVTRCPITLDPLSFAEFRSELLSPVHGKSAFQVGHLNPLKAIAITGDPRVGHTARNIGWISSDGNRIQGSLSLDETRSLLQRIWINYQSLGIM